MAESAAWQNAELAAQATAIVTGRHVIVVTTCAFVPHGIAAAMITGVLAATPTEVVFVADRSPDDIVRHPLDPARQPAISASRLQPGRIDFGDGRLFVLPSKSARAIRTALQQEIERG